MDECEAERAVVEAIGDLLADRRETMAIAESLTGGELSARFARTEGSSAWYRGAVVAYASDVKRTVLDVPDGAVVSEAAVRAMAEHGAKLLGAEIGVAVSGVAGPASQDGLAPGTVWLAIHCDGVTCTRLEHLTGSPSEVVEATVRYASAWLLEILRAGG